MKFFYNFCLKDDDTDLSGDILSGVRKGYFRDFQKIRDRITINSASDSVSYDYEIERDKPMSWEVRTQDKTVLQDVTPSDEGKYYICFYRDAKVYKRILFSRLHTLLKVEYYDTVVGVPMVTLEPRKAKSGLCILCHSASSDQSTVLYPMDEIADSRVRERVLRDFDNYTVSASTDEGIIRFLSDAQEKMLHVFIECVTKQIESEQEVSFVGDDTPLYDKLNAKDFNVKRNLASSLDITKADEFSFIREEELPSEDSSEEDSIALAAAAAISQAISDSSLPEEPAATISEPVPDDQLDAASSHEPDKMIMADGARYCYFGKLDSAGNRSGYGRTVTEDGRTAYEGYYQNDKRSGIGSYYYKDGSLCYTGDWVENVRHGVGVGVSSRDGSIHVGRWALNKPEGNGVRLSSDGEIRFVCRQLPDGTTVLTNYLPDGSLTIAKYDEKGKKIAEKSLNPDELFR